MSIPQDIEIEVEGVIFKGTYVIRGRTLTVSRGPLRKAALIGSSSPGVLARTILREIVNRELSPPPRGRV